MREKVVVVEMEEEIEWWWCRSSGGWLSQGRVFALEEQRSGRCGTTMRGEEGDNADCREENRCGYCRRSTGFLTSSIDSSGAANGK